MTTEITKPGRRKLIFDGDGSQFLPNGKPCSFCGRKMEPEDMPPPIFIRVREKLANGSTREIAHVCPDCVGRAFLQVERLSLWGQVSGQVVAAIKRVFEKKQEKAKGPVKDSPQKVQVRRALGSVPETKLPSRALEKLLPSK